LNEDERRRCEREHLGPDADDPKKPADQPTRPAKQARQKGEAETERLRRRSRLECLQGQPDVEQYGGDECTSQTEEHHEGDVPRWRAAYPEPATGGRSSLRERCQRRMTRPRAPSRPPSRG